MNEIPEEYLAMAALLGESNRIDSMLVEKPVGLVTDTNTLKHDIDRYRTEERNRQMPPQYHQAPQPQFQPTPQYIPPQPLPQIPQYVPPPKVDDGQMEFNLEPTKMDEIILLLKEISVKLTKQNSMLEKQHANQSKQERIQAPIVKLGKGQ